MSRPTMTEEDKAALQSILGDALLLADLRANWPAFCDCDWFSGCDTFPERMEAAGLVHLRSVDDDDMEQAFADEKGITAGGQVWDLTEKGRLAIDFGSQP